jgi:hypothetical protein
MVSCVEAGLELKYRFDMELCRKRSLWFDSCGDTRSEITSIRYEPVSEVYVVRRDILDDGEQSAVARFMSPEDAFSDASVGTPMSFKFLASGDEQLEREGRRYVKMRGTAWCKEERDQTLDRITEGLTFGLVKGHQFNSGWRKKKVESTED